MLSELLYGATMLSSHRSQYIPQLANVCPEMAGREASRSQSSSPGLLFFFKLDLVYTAGQKSRFLVVVYKL